MKVIVSIPAYNEEKTLPRVIREIKSVMNQTDYNYEILILNDGSKDRTAEVAKKAGTIVYSNPRNLGLAETFKNEMKNCIKHNADIIVHTDADGQYPAKYIPLLVKKVQQGYDLVTASRFGRGRYHGSIFKNLGNIAFAKVFSSLLKVRLTDTTTGFRAFTQDVARLPLINSFTYTQEQLIRAGRAKMKIAEIPIKNRTTRDSRLFKNPFDYAIKAWINIFRIQRDYNPIKFFGTIGLFLMFIGFIIGIYIIAILFTGLGAIDQRIPTIILAIVFFLTGLQVLLFGFLADMYQPIK
ncbi:glycosyltransferase family 2 protein [Candidatus Woesearchaeota archaeon]|nr:glycosyltransferase family 2 protein [Candidatus Woesearchaeota archaeon]